MDSLYERLKAAGCETGNHESDLHVRATEEARGVIAAWQKECGRQLGITIFRSNIDGRIWYDVPFLYDPWWQSRAGK